MYNKMTSTTQDSTINNKRDDNVKKNISSILLYALSLATALGFNDLVLNIFDSFKWTAHIISKTTYVVIMFGVTIGLAYYLNSSIK
jgi:hypothetical protein